MTFELNSYAVISTTNALIAALVAWGAWQRRPIAGASSLALMMLAACEWSLGAAFEFSAVGVPAKLLWSKIEYLGVVCGPVLLLLFALEYSELHEWLLARRVALLFLTPALTLLLTLTNGAHGLIWAEVGSISVGPNLPVIEHGHWFWVGVVGYSYALLLVASVRLLQTARRMHDAYRRQVWLMLLAISPPWIGSAIDLTGLSPWPGLSLTPFMIVFSGAWLGWNLARGNLLDLAPVARERLIETMADGMLVLDQRHRVVDANPAARGWLQLALNDSVGQPAAQVLMRWPKLLTWLAQYQAGSANTVLAHADGRYFEFGLSALRNPDGELAGRLITMRDVTARKHVEDEVRHERDLFTGGPVTIFVWVPKQGWPVAFVSNNVFEVLGYTAQEMQSSHFHFDDLVHPDDRERVDREVAHFINSGLRRFEQSYRVRHKNGEYRWLYDFTVPERNAQGDLVRVRGYVFDQTRMKQAEEQMELAALVFENSSEAMTVTDSEGNIIAINPAFTQITGYAIDEVRGRNPNILNSGRQDDEFYRQMWSQLNLRGSWQGELWNRRKNGEVYPERLTINTIFRQDGSVHRRVALFSDITERKRSEEVIWQQANFDPLTGLPNRRMFHDRLQQEVRKAHRNQHMLALVFIDLDRFKEINDTLGHDMGDVLLREAARRLVSCVRETDTVARLGGDEFTVILCELDHVNQVERVAQAILEQLAQPFLLKAEQAYVSASLGITLYPADATRIDELIKNADQAMYAAKEGGRNRASYYTPALQDGMRSRMRLIADLRRALSEQQFRLVYQPIVNLATGRIEKAEALIRWQHPTRGLINPAEFIPTAEETGLIIAMGEWVFQQAAQQVAQWRERHQPDFQISVNRSPVQFNSDRNSQLWAEQLRALTLPGSAIVVEITEGLLLDASSGVSEQLLAYRDHGVQVAIDDFGTGYSALSYLKKFHIDYLKIDQSFTRNLAPESDDLALCEAMIVMAHKLGISVVAEGVETAEQRDLLAGAGCDHAQGFLFSQPLPPKEFEQLLSGRQR